MTNDELNQYLHQQVLGLCWHDVESDECGSGKCRKCGSEDFGPFHGDQNPDYCNSLDAMAPVEAACTKAVGEEAYTKQLIALADNDCCYPSFSITYGELTRVATASALTRAKAVHAAMEAE